MSLLFKTFLVTSSLSFVPTERKKDGRKSDSHTILDSSSLLTANKWIIPQYSPSMSRSLTDGVVIKHVKKLEEIKHIIDKVPPNSLESLLLIDTLQRLNIDYHFREEINLFLQRQYVLSSNNGFQTRSHNLHELALRFRILRQQGHYVPADVFERFTNSNGDFKQELKETTLGMMSFYEASQMSIIGESILEKAEKFSSRVLNEYLSHGIDPHQARSVRYTLDHPYHKSLSAFTLRDFYGDCWRQDVNNGGCMKPLQELAKLDFTIVQSMHHYELQQISEWWEKLGVAKELMIARDQPLKWYTWSMGCLTDPNLSKQRIELTKSISFIYLLDDIYDVHGKLDDLTRFTEAISRWDIDATESLPNFMKICFKALQHVTYQTSYEIYEKHGWNPIDSLRNTWTSLCNAFLVEAKWFTSGQIPKADEYLKNGIVSSGVHVVLAHIFFLLGHDITKEKVEILDTVPAVVSSTAEILRLWDDMGCAKDENQEGNDGSYLEYYMKEHQISSMEKGREHVKCRISEAWKRLNRECLLDNSLFPATFRKASLNLARMVPLMYDYDDTQSLPSLEKYVKFKLYGSVD